MHIDSDEKRDDDETDAELFRRQMQDVVPLEPDNRVRRQAPRKPRVGGRETLPAEAGHRFATSAVDGPVPETLAYAQPGVQKNRLRQLRQGKLPLDARIDLHGLDVEQARDYLLAFLTETAGSGARTVLIVHGKGHRSRDRVPVIKAMLDRWLRDSPEVLAFHSAQPKDGGSGALYVMLKT